MFWPPLSNDASMASLGSLPEPWLSNGPLTLTLIGELDGNVTEAARSSLPDLMSFLPENVSLRSWFGSLLELALSPPPPHPASRLAASTAIRRMRSGRERMSEGLQHTTRRNFEPSIGVM